MKRSPFAIYRPGFSEGVSLPLFASAVQGGFPSPVDDFVEKELNLHELLIEHPIATFYVRVQGDSMQEAHISPGDILVVDRAIEPVSGKIVVAILDGEFTVKRLLIKGREVYLKPENPKFPLLKIKEGSDFQVWGVVTYIIHKAV